jgi:hypothetical protein
MPGIATKALGSAGDSGKLTTRWRPAPDGIIAAVLQPNLAATFYQGFPLVFDDTAQDEAASAAGWRWRGWRTWTPTEAGEKIRGILWTPEVTTSARNPGVPASGVPGASTNEFDVPVEILVAGTGFLGDVIERHPYLIDGSTASAQGLAVAFYDMMADARKHGSDRLMWQDVEWKPAA